MDALLNNKFLTGSNSERVKQCLLHGHAIPSTRVSDGILSASVSMRTYSTVDGYDGDLYPRRDSVLNDTNPLSQHESNLSSPKQQQLPSSQSSSFILQSPQKYNFTSLNEDDEENSLDPYLVKDEPTKFQKISFDFNISTEWRRTYDRISRVFGGLNTKSTTITGTSEDEIITAMSVLSPTTTTGNSKISLTGMVLLVSVSSCFAGYAYYTTKKMKR